jgi:hypothetical protein
MGPSHGIDAPTPPDSLLEFTPRRPSEAQGYDAAPAAELSEATDAVSFSSDGRLA